MKLNQLVNYIEQISNTTLRNEKTEILSTLIKNSSKSLPTVLYILQGKIVPDYDSLEFGLSTKSLIKAVAKIAQANDDEVLLKYKELGDIGELYRSIVSVDSGASEIDVDELRTNLLKIALISGSNSQSFKQQAIVELLNRLGRAESVLVLKLIEGNLRLGLNTKTLLDALSVVFSGDKSLRKSLDEAFGVMPDIGKIANVLLQEGAVALSKIGIQPGVPVASKLVEREPDTAAIFERMGPCYVQPKYDGLRLQVHYDKNGIKALAHESQDTLLGEEDLPKVKIYSRNLSDMTHMMPEIVEACESLGLDSFVLDSEAMAFDPVSKKTLPFQETIKRKRKSDIAEKAGETPLRVYAFDILYMNGEQVFRLPLVERLQILQKIFDGDKIKENFVMMRTDLAQSHTELETKFRDYIGEGLEGIIVKTTSAKYEPGTRNYEWVKLKAASQSELADTVDAVVLGYYKGTGARAKLGVGALLLGCYDPANGKFVTLAKLGTGLKDDEWVNIREMLDKNIENGQPAFDVDATLKPDVFLKPSVVVEVEADEVTRSQVHGAGYSLRFPRFKGIRYDKSPEQITTVAEIIRLAEIRAAKS